jgi:hypothetical protein
MSDIYKSKSAGIIRGLIPAELPLFRSWLNRDSVNDMRLLRLFDFYAAHFRNANAVSVTKEEAWKSVNGKLKFNDMKFRYLNADLVTRLEEFLVYRRTNEIQRLREEIISAELGSRGAVKAWNTHYRNFSLQSSTEPVHDADYFSHAWNMEYSRLSLMATGKVQGDADAITKAAGYLDRFYLIRKLQLCCEMFNVQNVFAQEYQVFLLDEILQHIGNRSYEDTPVIIIYYRILMTLRESEKEEHYHALRELLHKHEHEISLSELRDMYKYVLNYCIKKINLGNISWQGELFDIYKTTVTNRVLMSEGFLSHRDFKNIVTIALRQNQVAWTGEFIEQFIHEVPSEERENAKLYNTANLLFHKRDYSGAIRVLQRVDFLDIFYDLDARSILLKTWFELDEQDSFEYHATAFRKFLKRNKSVSDYQRTIYENLISFASRLMKAGTSASAIKKISSEISEKKNVADLRWLLAKIEERL